MLKAKIKNIFRHAGINIGRFHYTTHPLARRIRLFSHYKINLVFDVGANIGQYACQIRELGYSGRIVSFEPLSAVYRTLVTRADGDPNWDTDNIALGDFDGKTEINISKTSGSSSILDMLPVHIAMAPGSSLDTP